MIVLAID